MNKETRRETREQKMRRQPITVSITAHMGPSVNPITASAKPLDKCSFVQFVQFCATNQGTAGLCFFLRIDYRKFVCGRYNGDKSTESTPTRATPVHTPVAARASFPRAPLPQQPHRNSLLESPRVISEFLRHDCLVRQFLS
jgi:hypothetical protein